MEEEQARSHRGAVRMEGVGMTKQEREELIEKMAEAACEIERLREENARLRETLQYIAGPYNNSTTSKDRLAFLARAAIRENDK